MVSRFALISAVLCVGTVAVPAAAGEAHWAYVPPRRAPLPAVGDARWTTNAIDRFILARLESEGLRPSPMADRAKLLRRVYLDLAGLPPTPAEVEAFEADRSPDAYEKMVDRLLDSPAYGEKWARPWLDLARYADSNGFQRDGFRQVWAYRDWVVDALNADIPYRRFVVEQIAGDLLPHASLASRIATGFNRNTTVNVEAGTDPEEDRFKQVVDRVNTTATVFLGTTLECAQCHDHKHDPFTQADYYRFFAYFNNTPVESMRQGPATLQFQSPELELPRTPEQEALLASLQEERKELQRRVKSLPAAASEVQPKIAELGRRIAALQITTLVMRELPEPRVTHIMKRGSHLDPADPVTPGTPASLPPLSPDAPPDRLGLARWIADPDNPLPARVAVNRFWAELFGRGLVATPEDFGTQGERPTHPELLDWLAVEWVESGGSMKHIHRLLVTSATYRQDSRLTPEMLRRDPENHLLARASRPRLPAETLRDQALSAAGLLSRKIGGPPVFPPQPPDIWRVTGLVDNTYRESEGEDRHRRGLYTIRRRSGPYPSFANFDAPDFSACTVQRPRTNTPLQALTLMNDPVYVEAARAIASRILADRPAGDPADRLNRAFRLVLARAPTGPEKKHLLDALTGHDDLAAWTRVATILLNLDEAVTRN